MRCKKHPCDLSNSVGVCASCLRERLLPLVAAQAQVQYTLKQAQLPQVDDSRKLQSHPPPFIFPRSVSPYVTRRKSEDESKVHDLRFYSTPQVGLTVNSTTAKVTASRNKKHNIFSLLSNAFRTRSKKLNPDSTGSGPGVSPLNSNDFCTISSGCRKEQSGLFSTENSGAVGSKPRREVNGPESHEDCEECNLSASGSGYLSGSSHGWERTSVGPAARKRGKARHVTSASGLPFCLSPLMRASPKRHWSHKCEMGLSGDSRVPAKPGLSTAAVYCANRSRELADFGRVNHNR